MTMTPVISEFYLYILLETPHRLVTGRNVSKLPIQCAGQRRLVKIIT